VFGKAAAGDVQSRTLYGLKQGFPAWQKKPSPLTLPPFLAGGCEELRGRSVNSCLKLISRSPVPNLSCLVPALSVYDIGAAPGFVAARQAGVGMAACAVAWAARRRQTPSADRDRRLGASIGGLVL